MSIIYPEYLPCFSASDYAYTNKKQVSTTTFQSGRTRQRKLFDSTPTYFSVSVIYNTDELGVFEYWLENDIDYIGWFDAKLKTGRGAEYWTVRLLNDKEISRNSLSGNHWKLSFNLEAKKAQFIDYFELLRRVYKVTDTFGDDIKTIVQRYNTDYYR